MQDARVRAALLVICLACLLGSGFVLVKGRQSAPPIVITAPSTDVVSPKSAALAPAASARRTARLYVDVAGAVQRPSLYILPPNSRMMQAIMAAGGPTAGADMDAVNLAQTLTDGEKIFVPKHSAAPKALSSALAPVAAIMPKPPSFGLPISLTKVSKGSGSGQSNKVSVASGEQIGLNSATLEQLERLPGVGPSMAGRILTYRQQAGGFSKIEDLTLVTGIGPKKFAKIQPFVTLN
ncbi:MAG: helix-hairpin-helix domain-containing protein [Janthinobacterium lividum]